MITLQQQHEEADIEVGVKPCHQTHYQLNEVPFVEFENVWILYLSLYLQNDEYFTNDRERSVCTIDVMRHQVQTLSTGIYESNWANEHDYVVYEAVEVLKFRNSIHQFIFDFVECFCVVFESESFMFCVDQ